MNNFFIRKLKRVVPPCLKGSIKRFLLEKKAVNNSSAPVIIPVRVKEFSRRNSSNGVELILLDGIPRHVKLLDNFTFEGIRRSINEQIVDILEKNSILFWHGTTYSNECSRVNILSDDIVSFLASVKKDENLANWYYEILDNNGKTISKPRLVTSLKLETSIDGIRFYQLIVSKQVLGFASSAKQGVEVGIWDYVGDESFSRKFISPRIFDSTGNILSGPCNLRKFEDDLSNGQRSLIGHINFPIDAVYTWVNGNDESWKKSRESAFKDTVETIFSSDANYDSRFSDHDELKYSLRSINQFAPWIRHIYIVTEGHVPLWLQEDPRITIVKHDQIWPDSSGLPSFNSHAIEACLHRIPGLAEHYLYLNDDVLFTRPVGPALFFEPSGISHIFWSRAQVDMSDLDNADNASSVAAKNARQLLWNKGLPGFSRKFYHAPAAIVKSRMLELEREFPESFRQTRIAQFRSHADIAASGSLYFNYALAVGWAVPGELRYDYIDPASSDGRARMTRLLAKRDLDCVVINDASNYAHEDMFEVSEFIKDSLDKLLPMTAPWERD